MSFIFFCILSWSFIFTFCHHFSRISLRTESRRFCCNNANAVSLSRFYTGWQQSNTVRRDGLKSVCEARSVSFANIRKGHRAELRLTYLRELKPNVHLQTNQESSNFRVSFFSAVASYIDLLWAFFFAQATWSVYQSIKVCLLDHSRLYNRDKINRKKQDSKMFLMLKGDKREGIVLAQLHFICRYNYWRVTYRFQQMVLTCFIGSNSTLSLFHITCVCLAKGPLN